MGNEANCQRFCDHKEQENHEILSEIKMNEYPLECELCHHQIEHIDFKLHLDTCHYASIQEKNHQISVICVLCDKSSLNLFEHKMHLTQKHSYMLKNVQAAQNNDPSQVKGQNYKKILTARQIKSILREIDTLNKVKISTETEPNQFNVQYQNKPYKMRKFSKEYDGMEYDQNQVFCELVLGPILLNQISLAKYFAVERTPLERTILCDSFILMQKR